MARRKAQTTAATQELGYPINWNIAQQGINLASQIGGRQLLVEMQMMADTDETVGSMMWCIGSTLAQVEWKHEAQVDGKKTESDPQATAAAEFADTLLIDMKRSFADHVDDAMTMVWAGFAPCEIVLKQRKAGQSRFDDSLWGIDDIPLRDPLTIWWWQYSDDRREVLAARQQSYMGGATLPMWKLCLYRTTSAADQPQGRPLLKNAWRSWRLKNRIQDTEANGIERELVGLPIFRIPESEIELAAQVDSGGAPTPAALAAQKRIQNAIATVSSVRFNKTGGLVLPSDTFASDDPEVKSQVRKWDFETLTSNGQRTIDVRTAIRDYDRAIARVVMMQFLHLGDRSTGSFALSDDQSSMAIRSLMALAVKVADEFSRKALGLVWDVNGMDRRYMPALKPSQINKDGVQQIGAFLTGLSKAEWLIGADSKARTSVLRTGGIDYDLASQEKAATTSAEAADLAADPPAPPPLPGAAPLPDEED